MLCIVFVVFEGALEMDQFSKVESVSAEFNEGSGAFVFNVKVTNGNAKPFIENVSAEQLLDIEKLRQKILSRSGWLPVFECDKRTGDPRREWLQHLAAVKWTVKSYQEYGAIKNSL